MSKFYIGNAPVSWGIYEADDDAVSWDACLDAIAEAGYEGTELGPYGYLPTDPTALAIELNRRKLKLGSSFVPMNLPSKNARDTCIEHALRVGELLKTQGVQYVICADEGTQAQRDHSGRADKPTWSIDEWKNATGTLKAVARALRDKHDMSTIVHHHAGTGIESRAEIDQLLEHTKPGEVDLLLDTGHALYGGADPLKLIEDHAERVVYLHYKDVDPEVLNKVKTTDLSMENAWKQSVFCQLGEGCIDFAAITEHMRSRDYVGWVIVEQDVVPDADGKLNPDPVQSARASRRFLRNELGL